MKLALVLLPIGLLTTSLPSPRPSAGHSGPPLPYPEGFRGWTHVKSTVVNASTGPLATNRGYQHIYANDRAMEGYRTRSFPERSIVVVDGLAMEETNGVFREGARRQLDMMVKDSTRFASTGGWGFQRFAGDGQCYACHEARKRDGLILSHYRERPSRCRAACGDPHI